MGISHPRDPRTGIDIVMTTDLVRNIAFDRKDVVVPYFIKPKAELAKARVKDKLEIERRYWASFGMKLQIMTDVELRDARFENIRWLRDWYWTDGAAGLDETAWQALCRLSMTVVATMSESTIGEVCRQIAKAADVRPSLALSALRHLAARRRLLFDVSPPRPVLSDTIRRFALPTDGGQLGIAA